MALLSKLTVWNASASTWLPRAIVLAATVWISFCAAYGNLGIPDGGHLGGGQAANYMASEAMLRHHLWYPTFDWFTVNAPDPRQAYCHHPFGLYWIGWLTLRIFGVRDWVLGLPSIAMSTAMPVLIYRTFRDGFGRMPAAIGALVFTLIPIEVGFAGFHNLEVAPMFGFALFAANGVRWLDKGKRLSFWLALLGALVTVCTCWIGYLFLFVPLTAGLFAEFTAKRLRLSPPRHGRAVQLWVWSVVIAVGSFFFWIWAFHHLGKLGDLLLAYTQRAGVPMTMAQTLESRKEWLDVSFQPVLRSLTVLAIPLFFVRPLLRRRFEETIGLGALFGGLGWYLGFTQGADAHVFWPMPLTLSIAIGAAALVATAGTVVTWLGARVRRPGVAAAVSTVGAGAALACALCLVPDAVRMLQVWKQTGGRYDENGRWAFGEGDDADFALVKMVRPVRRKVSVNFHGSFGQGWWDLLWAAQKNPDKLNAPLARGDGPQLLLTRASNMAAADFLAFAGTGKITRLGDVMVADSRSDGPALAYRVERTPTLLEKLVHGSYVYTYAMPAEPDAFDSWELQVHLGQPAALPARAPVTLDERRIVYNASVAAGAPNGVLEQSLVAELEIGTHATVGPVELLGVRRETGPSHEIELWMRTTEALKENVALRATAECTRALPYSFIPRPKRVLPVFVIPSYGPAAWRPGFLYVTRIRPKHRPCVERFRAEVVGPGGKASGAVVLMTLH